MNNKTPNPQGHERGIFDKDEEGFYHCCKCDRHLMIGGSLDDVHDTSMYCGVCLEEAKEVGRLTALKEVLFDIQDHVRRFNNDSDARRVLERFEKKYNQKIKEVDKND